MWNKCFILSKVAEHNFKIQLKLKSHPKPGVFNPRPSCEFCVAREGYFTKYSALWILKLESLYHGRARVAHCVTGWWRNFSHYYRPLRQYDVWFTCSEHREALPGARTAHGVHHGCARVAHCVTARWRNFFHYCRPLRHYDVWLRVLKTEKHWQPRRQHIVYRNKL